jgi:putative ABC transport system permease protein
MWRRKLRTALTVFGIVIGIFAFTVMGSMAEKINKLIGGALAFYGNSITESARGGGGFGGGVMETATVDKLRTLTGVADVQPSVDLLLADPGEGSFSFGPPNLITGAEVTPAYVARLHDNGIKVGLGSYLSPGDTGQIVVGSDIADQFRLKVGSTLTIRKEAFTVKGILERTLRFTDKIVTMSISDARRLLTKDYPLLKTGDVVTSAQVFAASGVDADALAAAINQQVPEARAYPPTELRKQFQAGTVIFNLIIFGVALIAVIVGGLSVINTMIMSVSERTREIGIKRAVGAKTHHIVLEYVQESAFIGLFGGVIGFGLGWILTIVINQATKDSGTVLFTMTPRLAIGALLFAVVLGTVAGLYPAFRAARMNPVKALRTM